MINQEIKRIYREIEDEVVNIRRNIHRNPELAYEEFSTSKYILEKLKSIGIEEIDVIENTGIVALLRGEKCINKENPTTIMLRADMDALPIKEETNLTFKSRNNNMHACGHDVHIAWTLGVAIILSRLKKLLNGNIKFVFQPAEEIGGSVKLVKKGVLNSPEVDIVLAGHCWPDLEAGKIGIARDVAMASANTFKIKILGKGGHGAEPHNCIDPICIGNEIYSSIQKIVSRRINPIDSTVVSICSFNSGYSSNIIPDTCEIQGTVRSLSVNKVIEINKNIELVVSNICNIYGAKYSFEMGGVCLPVVNDSILVNKILESATDIIGCENINIVDYPSMTGEDFSEYCNKKPGLFIYVGSSSLEKGIKEKLHSSKFDIDESMLETAVAVFSKFIIDYLAN